VDITEIKRTQEELRGAKEYAEAIVETVNSGLVVLGNDLHIESANKAFFDLLDITPEHAEGRLIYDVGEGQWDRPQLRELLEDVLPENHAFNDFEVTLSVGDGSRRTMLLNARALNGQQRILLAIDDITERQRAMDRLRELNDTLERRVEERTEQIRELATRLSAAEHEERKRIAQILHDELQQRLYGVQMKMKTLRNEVEAGDSGDLLEMISKVEEWVTTAIDLTRQLSVDLSPPVLKKEGLVDALGWLRTQMKERHELRVDLTADEALRVPDDSIRALLFQVVRELLFNVVKHAGVDEARVEVARSEDGMTISVIDAGQGFDAERINGDAEPEGFGLTAIRDRIELFGGQMDIQSTPGDGTRMDIHVPRSVLERAGTE
jgi:PAS domain S-box-containing protein